MGSKVCFQCRSEVDLLASVCPNCRAKLGKARGNGVAKKRTSFAVGCLAVFLGLGLMGSIIGQVMKPAQQPAAAPKPADPIDPKYGKKPDEGTLQIILGQDLPAGLHDPSSFQDLEVYAAEKDTIKIKGKPTGCWRVGFSFRAKNGFGAIRQTRGHIWMRDDNILQQKISE